MRHTATTRTAKTRTRPLRPNWYGMTLEEDLGRKRKDRVFRAGFMERRLIGQAAVLVRAMREAAGFSQADLAERAGMHQSVIARLESGKAKAVPSLTTLAKIAAATGIPLRLTSKGKHPIATIDLVNDEI